MPGLFVAEAVDKELDELVETHPDDVGLIDALIEELACDEDALRSLAQDVPKHLYMLEPPFKISKFHEAWDRGYRVYSLKPFDEEGHRIGFRVFVGHDIGTDDWYVLSIQPRSTCYEPTTDSFRDLCARYGELGIPTLRNA